MSKKISMSFMFIILFCLVIIILGIIKAQPKIKLIDINGSKVNIGNALFISQKNNGFYCNTQSITSKDEFKFKNNSKLIQKENKSIKGKYQNDEVFKTSYDEDLRYYGKKNIGYIQNTGVVGEKNRINIFNKNLEDNSIKIYNLDVLLNNNTAFIQGLTVDIKDNDIYILCSQNKGENIDPNTGRTSSVDGLEINVYKFNLKSGESKKVGEFVQNKEIDDLETYCFHYNRKLYSLITTYQNSKKDNIELFLIFYDIKENKIEKVKLSESKGNSSILKSAYKAEDYEVSFKVENDKLYILNKNEDNEKYIKLEQYTINLKNNKIDKVNTYEVEKIKNISNIESFRLIDKKLYLCLRSYDSEQKTDYTDIEYKNIIVVLDEKSKETLYMGEYIEDLPELTDQFILKTDEI